MKKALYLTIMAMSLLTLTPPAMAGGITLLYTANTRGEIDPVVV